jgi:hypothetical protein
MCAVAWDDLEMEVPTFLVRHFTPHKSAEHFLDGSFHSGIRLGIGHRGPRIEVSLSMNHLNPANDVF